MKNCNYSIGLLQKRLLVFLLLITFFFIAIIFRIGVIQFINGSSLQFKAVEQWTRDVPLKAKRGAILDTNGNALAYSISTYDIYIRHKNVTNGIETAKYLSEKLNLQFEKVYQKVMDDSLSETVIKLQVPAEVAGEIINKRLDGVILSEGFSRKYTFGDLFTQVLGFTTIDGVGQFGLESFYDNILQGVNGSLLTQSDVRGQEISNTLDYFLPSQMGLNIRTTLDYKIQMLLEEQLQMCIEEQKATKGMGIILNPNTGEILAMSCKPSFDLNNIPREDITALLNMSKNMLITDIYEPGSTFKILTSAIALNEGVVRAHDEFYDPGYRIVDSEKIKCWKLIGHGHQTFRDGFCNSCNSVFIDMALRLGTERFYKCLNAFGIGDLTNIDFQGETTGIMMNKEVVKRVDLARIGFGQAVAVSPIQLAMALSATINGGYLLAPYIVKQIETQSGNIISYTNKEIKRKVISDETSYVIRDFLEDAVSRPLGKYTFIPGYSVGGKTGTTQKYVDGKISGTYISSFFGVYPCDNPKYAILFIIDEPTAGSYYGSIVATPYAKKIIEGIILLNDDKPVNEDVGITQIVMPNLIGLSLLDANEKLRVLELNYELVGEGGVVYEQFPLKGALVNKNQIVQIKVG